jgi:hypothetical protein
MEVSAPTPDPNPTPDPDPVLDPATLVLMGYSGVEGKLIYDINLQLKKSRVRLPLRKFFWNKRFLFLLIVHLVERFYQRSSVSNSFRIRAAWIRIRNIYSGSGSGKKFRIRLDPDPTPDPDPQHCQGTHRFRIRIHSTFFIISENFILIRYC